MTELIQIDLVHTGCCLRSFFIQAVCHFPSLFFCMIQTMLYKCNPTSIQHFLNTPGQHYLLRAESWKRRARLRRWLVSPSSIVLDWICVGYLVATVYWKPPSIPRTHTLKNTSSDTKLLVAVLFKMWGFHKSTEKREKGCVIVQYSA